MNKLSARGVARFAEQLAPFIARPLMGCEGEMAVEDVLRACLLERMQLWVICKGEDLVAVATTEVVDYPKLRALRIVTLGGAGASDWSSLLYFYLARFACQWNCRRMEAYGRPGLARMFKSLGFRDLYMGVVRDLTTG